MTAGSRFETQALAKLACAFSGLTWGLFWLPLRWLDEAGVEGPWVGVVFFGLQALLIAPLLMINGRRLVRQFAPLAVTTFFAGSALALYSLAIIYTDVIRAILLFYLTPIWSTALAWWWLRQRVTLIRWLAIALALCGMAVMFGAEAGLPLPRTAGDWMGLASGVMWAIASVRLHQDRASDPVHVTFGFLVWGGLLCTAVALAGSASVHPVPDLHAITGSLYWLLPVLLVLALPGAYTAMWGARLIDPAVVGLLLMTEIVVGAITAALWAGEPFGLRELLGVLMITGAGALESGGDILKRVRSDRSVR